MSLLFIQSKAGSRYQRYYANAIQKEKRQLDKIQLANKRAMKKTLAYIFAFQRANCHSAMVSVQYGRTKHRVIFKYICSGSERALGHMEAH